MKPPAHFDHPRYEIVRLLGEGGMGKVFLARDRLEDLAPVALKVYPAGYCDERLRREFLALRELRHPGIARALSFGLNEAQGAPFFTLEYIEGPSLSDHVARAGRSRSGSPADRLAGAAAVLSALAGTVAYLHRREVLHLDIKPSNVLVVEHDRRIPPRPVLIDFGLVQLPASARVEVGHGTLPFMPPEFFRGEPPTPASDVYSLAATVYRVLLDRYPVSGEDFRSLHESHRSGVVTRAPELPRALEAVLLRGLAKDPGRRFPDAGAFHGALEAAVSEAIPGESGRRGREASPVVFHEPEFVGRSREIEALTEWLDADRRPTPLLEVSAGAGWGKSRFLERAATLIEIRGHEVVFLRCAEGIDSPTLRKSLARAEATLRRTRRTKELNADDEISRRRLVARLAPHLARNTFILVDDLHLARPADARLVDELAAALEALPHPPGGGIVVSRRGPSGVGSPKAATLPATIRRIELGRLSLDDALEIDLEGLDGALSTVSPHKARRWKARLYREVGGHPLFYVHGLLELAGRRGKTAPPTPEGALARRLQGIATDTVEVAAAIVSLDRPTTAAELAGILGRDRASVEAAIRSLRYEGILSAMGPKVRVIHDQVRGAVVGLVGPKGMRGLHVRAAAWLERASERRRDLEIAWHLFRAGLPGEAVIHATRHVEETRDVVAGTGEREVGTLLRAASSVGRRSPEGERFVEAAADALDHLGRYEACLKELSRLARPAGSRARGGVEPHFLRRLRKLGSLCQRMGRVRQAQTHLEGCISASAAAAAPQEALIARMELAQLYHFRGRPTSALEHARCGIELWKGGDRGSRRATLQTAVHLHAILGQIHIRGLEFPTAIDVLREGLRLAERARSTPDVAILLNNLALAYHLAGQFAPALRILRRAEAHAVETEDRSALVSIRVNIAQILAKRGQFREAREILEEAEDSAPARQSARLRLLCSVTRGLLLRFMRLPSDDVWQAVEKAALSVGDPFLARLAAVYRAEDLIPRGELAAARKLLEPHSRHWKKDPILASIQTSRLAWVEALAGHTARSRRLRQRLTSKKLSIPTQLLAWNLLYSGAAALESADSGEARASLESALASFRTMGFPVGEAECHLLLADLHLRAPHDEASVTKAQGHVRWLRKVGSFERAGGSTDSLEVRRTLLECRCTLASVYQELLRDPARRRGREARRRPEGDMAEALSELSDRVTRVAGDLTSTNDLEFRRALEVVTAATAHLRGEPDLAGAAGARAFALARTTSARDPWVVLGLQPFQPASGEVGLDARLGTALANVLCRVREARTDGSPPIDDVLAIAATSTGACRADVVGHAAVVSAWGSTPARGEDSVLWVTPVSVRPVASAWLRLWRVGKRPFSPGERRFLAAIASTVAPLLDTRPNAASRDTAPRSPSAPTAELTRTRALSSVEPSPRALRSALRDQGVLVTDRLQRLIPTIRSLASCDLPVLITGESGTGKNVVARLLHQWSSRRAGPLVVHSASAVPPDLFEADLFGYESGAFTGAERTRTGFLFQADGGTFHLEEVGGLDPVVQQLLLRVVEEGAVRPLGSASTRTLNVRFVASTHEDIDELVDRGAFRKDLLYRLGAARIHVPALREYPADIPELVSELWQRLSSRPHRLPKASLTAFQEHDWPGNFRELISVLRRLSLEATSVPSPAEVRSAIGPLRRRSVLSPDLFLTQSYEDVSRSLEEAYLLHLLQRHEGRLEAIAEELGTTTRSIYRRFERVGLRPRDLRGGEA